MKRLSGLVLLLCLANFLSAQDMRMALCVINFLETFFYLYLLVFHFAIILKEAKSFSRYYAALFL